MVRVPYNQYSFSNHNSWLEVPKIGQEILDHSQVSLFDTYSIYSSYFPNTGFANFGSSLGPSANFTTGGAGGEGTATGAGGVGAAGAGAFEGSSPF